jgi:hypothetical protein
MAPSRKDRSDSKLQLKAGNDFDLAQIGEPTRQPQSDNSDQPRSAFDQLKYLSLRIITFSHVSRQPLAAGPEQAFKGIADWRIGLKVWGNHANPSVISIRSRPVIAANGIAQAIEQGA